MNMESKSDPKAILAELQQRLRAVAPKFVEGATEVPKLVRLSGGASQETWSFTVVSPAGESAWILRRAPLVMKGGANRNTMAAGLDTEAKLLRLSLAAGVPVPEVGHVLTPEDAMGTGFIMRHVEGETMPRRILREERFAAAREQLAFQCGACLARIHSIPLDTLPPLRSAPGFAEVDAYRARYDEYGFPKPVFELAFRWLYDNPPSTTGQLSLVHGDFRHGNLMIDENGLAAALDWELAHLGDPMEDLGWMCVNAWRFGVIDKPVGGFGTREQMCEGYASVTGKPVDMAALRYWEVFGTLKWGVICDGMANTFKTGTERTVERATIGRRASETDIDLLALLAPRNQGA